VLMHYFKVLARQLFRGTEGNCNQGSGFTGPNLNSHSRIDIRLINAETFLFSSSMYIGNL
jgi:hypothetical protein